MAARLDESARDVPGIAYANLAHLLGHAELVRADLAAAVKHLHEAYAGVETHEITTGLRVASCFCAGRDARQARPCAPRHQEALAGVGRAGARGLRVHGHRDGAGHRVGRWLPVGR